MHETHDHSDSPSDVEAELGTGSPHRVRSRLVVVLAFLLAVLVLVFIPPLINVSRFKRSVDRNISAALGRPVHFDRLSLTLLPVPGFTLDRKSTRLISIPIRSNSLPSTSAASSAASTAPSAPLWAAPSTSTGSR